GVSLRVPDLQVAQEEAEDREEEPHDQAHFDDPVHREEERLQARALALEPGVNQENGEGRDAGEGHLPGPADTQETVRSLDSIDVPRHGRLASMVPTLKRTT